MKLLSSFGPNPRMVRMFMIEKGIDIEQVELDIMGGDNRQPGYTDKNPGGTTPALELDDGNIIAETVVICDYLEELHPTPALVGTNGWERAEARMWNRRIESRITEPMYAGFRSAEGLEMFKDRVRCYPQAADDLKKGAQEGMAWLDNLLEGKQFLCGDRLTIGDLVLYCCIDFMGGVGQTVDPSFTNVTALISRIGDRPSAQASLHPATVSGQVPMRG